MKKSSRLPLVIVSAVACLLSIKTAIPGTNSDREEITEIRSLSNDAIQRHDVAGIVAPFDDEYQLTTGKGVLFHNNPEEQKALWAEHFSQFDDVVYVRTPTTIEVGTYLPRAVEFGTWVGKWTLDKGGIEVGGSYSASWRRIDNEWKIQSEIFVTLYCKGEAC